MLFVLVGLSCFGAGVASATLSGPTIVDVLGWDSKTNRVYFTVTTFDQGSQNPTICYVPIDEASDFKPNCVENEDSGRQDLADSLQARVEELRNSLNSLQASLGDTAEVLVSVVKQDSVLQQPMDPPVPRYRQDVFIRQDDFECRFQVTAYCRPGGRVVNWLMTRDPDIRLTVYSFNGNPMEGCYETQEIIVLRRK